MLENEKNIKNLPIGIFDSGVGGLTVLKAIRANLPAEKLLYLGDTARLPYGTKSATTVANYSLQAASKLVERGIKVLVVACNTATAASLPALRKAFAPLPVLGVIEPGALAAVNATQNQHIAVIATEGTIHGGAYQKAISKLNSSIKITGKACTLFVPLAEEGWFDGELVEGIAKKYLNDTFRGFTNADKPDTLLLGCTHFPLLRNTLAKVVGDDVHLVDSAETTAKAVVDLLNTQDLNRELDIKLTKTVLDNQSVNNLNKTSSSFLGQDVFMTTDDKERFARVGSIFLGKKIFAEHIEQIDL